MLKKILIGTGITAALTGMFLLGSLSTVPAFSQASHNSMTQSTIQRSNDGSAEVKDADVDQVEEQVGDQNQVDEQQPQYTGSINVDEAQFQSMSESDEAVALQNKATISSAQAEAAALAANPGTTVIKTELDNENGSLVYSVGLSNGMDVKVDAGNGKILHTEAAGTDSKGELGEQETAED